MGMNARFVRQFHIVTLSLNTTVNRNTAGSLLDNAGQTQPRTATIADAEVGDFYGVDVAAAQSISIDAGSRGVFVLNGTAGDPGQKLQNSGTVGESCEIVCVGAGPTFRVRNPVGSHWSLV